MSQIIVGSVVSIDGDLHEANLYEVLKIKDQQARLKLLSPREDTFWIDLDDLILTNLTKQQAIDEWRSHHDYSGI